MHLTPLESTALLAIAQAGPLGEPILTNSLSIEQGYMKLAGAISSLGRKGLVESAGTRPGNGGLAKESRRTVRLTEIGIQELHRREA